MIGEQGLEFAKQMRACSPARDTCQGMPQQDWLSKIPGLIPVCIASADGQQAIRAPVM